MRQYERKKFHISIQSGTCGLTDASNAGDWRLPNRRELFSLVHDEYYDPALPDTAGTGKWSAGDPFTNVQSSFYWSATTLESYTSAAWDVSMHYGDVSANFKSLVYYVWPVRSDN